MMSDWTSTTSSARRLGLLHVHMVHLGGPGCPPPGRRGTRPARPNLASEKITQLFQLRLALAGQAGDEAGPQHQGGDAGAGALAQQVQQLRRDTKAELLDLLTKLRARIPGLVLRTSLITGLPGEGEAELEELCVFLRGRQRSSGPGVFPFSPEEGTRAARMDHVDMEEARRRAELVVDVQSDIIDAYNESVLGTEREVLCEGFDSQAQMHFGRSYAESPDIDGRIWFDANREVEPGTFVTVRLTGVMDGELTGELAEE